jgi:hypothetical protein
MDGLKQKGKKIYIKRGFLTRRPGHDGFDCRLKRLMLEWLEKPVAPF